MLYNLRFNDITSAHTTVISTQLKGRRCVKDMDKDGKNVTRETVAKDTERSGNI